MKKRFFVLGAIMLAVALVVAPIQAQEIEGLSSITVQDGGVLNLYVSGETEDALNEPPADELLGGNTRGTMGVGTTTPITTNVQADIYGNLILSGPDRYLNFDYTGGTSGYGFRDNNGTMQFKDASGAWSTFTTAVSSDVFAVDGENRYMYARSNADGVPYVVTAGEAQPTSTYAGTDNNTRLFTPGASNSSVFQGDVVIGSGARIGIGSSGGHITAQANDSLFVEGEAEFDGIVWFDGSLRASSTLMVTGASTLTGNVAALGTLAVTGASTLTGAVTASDTLAVTGNTTLSGTLSTGVITRGTLVLTSGSITDTSGSITFSDENLDTTGTLAAGNTTITGTITGSGDLTIGTTDFFVDVSTNRVGISSTTPQQMLSIQGSSDTQLGLGYDNGNYATFAVGSGGDLTIDATGSDILFPDAVSIGTSTVSAYALDVYGDIRFGETGNASAFTLDTGTGSLVINDDGTATADVRIEGDSVTSLLHVDASADRVGIGTSTPLDILHVENQTATSTAVISSGGSGVGGRLILEDIDGAGCSEASVLNGTVAWKSVTCPEGI